MGRCSLCSFGAARMDLYLPGEKNSSLGTVSPRQTKAALDIEQLSLTSSTLFSVNNSKQTHHSQLRLRAGN
jgi:hypothetical protein